MIKINNEEIKKVGNGDTNIPIVMREGHVIFPSTWHPDVFLCTDGGLIKVSSDDLEEYPDAVPVGVEVIPAEHDVYGTGEGAMMSLVNMSATTPEEGQVDVSSGQITMAWDNSQNLMTDVSLTGIDSSHYWKNFNLIENNTKSTLIGTLGNPSSSDMDRKNITSAIPYANIPTNAVSDKTRCLHDFFCQYNLTSSFCPSPYLTDSSRNPAFYSTELETDNVLSNFDGKGECQYIIKNWRDKYGEKDYSTWLPTGTKSIPAISSCDMFHVGCTEQKEWYLPSGAEICYAISRFNEINRTIAKVKKIYGYGYELHPNGYYWTSTMFNAKNGFYWFVNRGQLMAYAYNTKALVRAFRRFNTFTPPPSE